MNSILARLTAALFLTSALPAAEISWVTSNVANCIPKRFHRVQVGP